MTLFIFNPGTASGVGTIGGWRITSYFGGRIDPISGRPGSHGGMDLSAPLGTPFYAADEGYVTQGWDASGGGNWTTLACRDGSRWGYGHASTFAPGVNGTTVAAGTLLGYVGSTGKSTGPHMHLAYDSTDPGTAYDDPYQPMADAAAAGRFPGSLTTTPQPPEGLTMAQYDDIMASLARLEKAVGANLTYVEEAHAEDAQWEQDTRATFAIMLKPVMDQLDPRRQAGVAPLPLRDLVEQTFNNTKPDA